MGRSEVVGVFVALVVALVRGAPVGGGVLDASFVQTGAGAERLGLLEPYKDFNYTCDQCHRMAAALISVCEEKNLDSKGNRPYVTERCDNYTDRVSYGAQSAERRAKCDAFYDFVEELYCPYDPCVQLSIQKEKAHLAVCGLMRCNNDSPWPMPAIPRGSPWEGYNLPETCPTYLKAVLGKCGSEGMAGSKPEEVAAAACVDFPANFSRQGCEEVVSRMTTLSAPMRMCDAWSCDKPTFMSDEDICAKMLRIDPSKPVVVPEREYWLSQIEHPEDPTPIRLEDLGIDVSRATLGYGESCQKDHTNNILLRTRAQCQGLRLCHLDNPYVTNPKVLLDSEPGCEGNWAVEFTCVPGGRKHTIYAPYSATYKSLPIDCRDEVKAAAGKLPKPEKNNTALNAAPLVDADVFKGTTRKENSFVTPEQQKEIDRYHSPVDMNPDHKQSSH